MLSSQEQQAKVIMRLPSVPNFRQSCESVARAREIAKWIVERISTPQALMRRHAESGDRVGVDMRGLRDNRGLASGAAGVALLLAAFERLEPSAPWRERIHDMFVHATNDVAHGSLYTGHSGYALCASLVSRGTGRYRRMIEQLCELSAREVIGYCDAAQGAPFTSSHYAELIGGIAGQLLILDDARYLPVWLRAAQFFEWMTEDTQRWCVPNQNDPDSGPRNDLGVSHGIAGIMGSLALGPRTDVGITVVRRIAQLLTDSATDADLAPQWPSILGSAGREQMARAAWCYGSPGLSCVLFNAALYLQDNQLIELATRSVRALLARPLESWGMVDMGLCHGVAGNAVMLARMAGVIECEQINGLANTLFDQLLAAFDEQLPLGYDSYTLLGRIDAPGFLEGTAGIAMALLTLSGQIDNSWLRALAIL